MSKTYFLRHGNTFSMTDSANLDIRDSLPAGTYRLCCDIEKGFYLQDAQDMTVPERRYGQTDNLAQHVCTAFEERSGTTGILLVGEKGSGKTMTARMISKLMRERGVPTIIISQQYAGDSFIQFMLAITQPCVLLFDEFEKVFTDNNARTGILTLLDGVSRAQRLCVVTSNSQTAISEYMINRPSRLLYRVEFAGVDSDTINDYCNDKLKDKSQIPALHQLASLIGSFNFDMLTNLVEEMNRFNAPVFKAVKLMNIRPSYTRHIKYDVTVRPLVKTDVQIFVRRVSGLNPLHFGDDHSINVEFTTVPAGAKPPEGHDNINGYNASMVEGSQFYDEYLGQHELQVELTASLNASNVKGNGATVFRSDDFEFHVFPKKEESYDPFSRF